MARISGVDLPREKRGGLTHIYGIGRASADRILAAAGINPDTRVKDLTDDEVKNIAAVIAETQTVEGDLRRDRFLNTGRDFQEIGCCRSVERASLPPDRRQTQEHARVRERLLQEEALLVTNV